MKFLFPISFLFLVACHGPTPADLQQVLDDFQQELPVQFPDYATAMGWPGATDILIIPTPERLLANRQFVQQYKHTLRNFIDFESSPDLNDRRQETLDILQTFASRLNGAAAPESNPAYFHVLPALQYRVMQIKTGDEHGAMLLEKTLRKIPTYFETAKTVLANPDRMQTEQAVAQCTNTFEFLANEVATVIRSEPSIQRQRELEGHYAKARLAVKDYRAFCNSILVELQRLD